MSDSRGKPNKPISTPSIPGGEGPGRWIKGSGARPSTTTTRIRRPGGPKAS
ncbi:hypothetical protein ABZ604_20595 [Streptomyces sp. NPDC012473]|uniref:hypothetical protein n=1 Tax=Streptomyces sp. NPDC012473 TaxID=3156676 RepID=UPI0033E37AAA